MFKVTVGEMTGDVVGHRETIIRDSDYVAQVFEAAMLHARAQAWREEAARADQPSRQFRIEWLEGYDPMPPQAFPLSSFDPGLDRGFTFDDADALLEDAWLARMGPAHFATVNFRGTFKFGISRYAEMLLGQASSGAKRSA